MTDTFHFKITIQWNSCFFLFFFFKKGNTSPVFVSEKTGGAKGCLSLHCPPGLKGGMGHDELGWGLGQHVVAHHGGRWRPTHRCQEDRTLLFILRPHGGRVVEVLQPCNLLLLLLLLRRIRQSTVNQHSQSTQLAQALTELSRDGLMRGHTTLGKTLHRNVLLQVVMKLC